MSDIKIEKGIPLSTGRNYLPDNISEMEVGDSFLVKKSYFKSELERVRNNIHAKIKRNKETSDWKIKTRSDNGDLRVWRVK